MNTQTRLQSEIVIGYLSLLVNQIALSVRTVIICHPENKIFRFTVYRNVEFALFPFVAS